MKLFLTVFLFFMTASCLAQDSAVLLSSKMFDKDREMPLATKDGWIFKKGNDTSWANPNINTEGWEKLNPTELTSKMADPNGRLEGWFRLKINPDTSLTNLSLGFISNAWVAIDVYLDGKLVQSFGKTGSTKKLYQPANSLYKTPEPIILNNKNNYLLALHFVDYIEPVRRDLKSANYLSEFINLTAPGYFLYNKKKSIGNTKFYVSLSVFSAALTILFWLLYIQNIREKHLKFIAITVTCICCLPFALLLLDSGTNSYNNFLLNIYIINVFLFAVIIMIPLTVAIVFTAKIHKLHWYFVCLIAIYSQVYFFHPQALAISFIILLSFIVCLYYLISSWKTLKGAKWAIVIGLVTTFSLLVLSILFAVLGIVEFWATVLIVLVFLAFPLSLLVYVSMWFKETLNEVKKNAKKIIQVTEEKRDLLANQNILLEHQVNERTAELKLSLDNLKSAQSQLIQSEKMASLGELTAGIAHEIQNPLNFVNNFSEVNKELLVEMKDEISKGNFDDAKAIANDVIDNEEKINHHGKRADAIVKGMLQHSRSSDSGSGIKEPADINALADEYLRLAYHGLRAKDKSFNATLKTDYDESIGNIDIIPQDIGRVILNLITNAFYAVTEKKKQHPDGFEPTVSISTKKTGDRILVAVKDNGNGIPQKILDKIFQPFFTTKPTGQGTGLGLSLAYDIVKAHSGELKVETKEGHGTTFIIKLPV